MFGQIFLVLIGVYLMIAGVLDKEFINVGLGAFIVIQTRMRIYEFWTGNSFWSKFTKQGANDV